LREVELKEYNNLCERFKSEEGYQFEEFLDMIDHMCKPFVTEVEGHEVSLTQDDCVIMMETFAVCAITNLLFLEKINKMHRIRPPKTNSNEQITLR